MSGGERAMACLVLSGKVWMSPSCARHACFMASRLVLGSFFGMVDWVCCI